MLIISDVMPLIYHSLECEHMPVQEKVLKLVPHLCEILDYGTVQNVLLVNVAVRPLPPSPADCSDIADSIYPDSNIVNQGSDSRMLQGYGQDPR